MQKCLLYQRDTLFIVTALVPPICKTILPQSPYPKFVIRGRHCVPTNGNPSIYLSSELKTPRLDAIHQFLWIAGLPGPARPLHRQKRFGRTILLTEDLDEHLVCYADQILIKALPNFLLDYDCWSKTICADPELYRLACGFLLSYAWLIRHESDLDIAVTHGLISQQISWATWVEVVNEVFAAIDLQDPQSIYIRYRYGDLRLGRSRISSDSVYQSTLSFFFPWKSPLDRLGITVSLVAISSGCWPSSRPSLSYSRHCNLVSQQIN